MPSPADPRFADPPSGPDPERAAWRAMKRREFRDLLRMEGSIARASELHESTASDDPGFLLHVMCTPHTPVTLAATRERLHEEMSSEMGRHDARLALTLQHASLGQARERGELWERLAALDDQVRRRMVEDRDALSSDDLTAGEREALERHLGVLRLRQDDLYRQARLALEHDAIEARHEALERERGGAVDLEVIADLREAARARLAPLEEALEQRLPLRRLLALERARERDRPRAPSRPTRAPEPPSSRMGSTPGR